MGIGRETEGVEGLGGGDRWGLGFVALRGFGFGSEHASERGREVGNGGWMDGVTETKGWAGFIEGGGGRAPYRVREAGAPSGATTRGGGCRILYGVL